MKRQELKEIINEIVTEKYKDNIKYKKENSTDVSGQNQQKQEIPDIREDDYTKYSLVENPKCPEEFLRIKANTDARLGIGRCGPRYKTQPYLRILADHAGALDAVQTEPSQELIEENSLFEIQTLCDNKDIYMTRPDLGRQFSEDTKKLIKAECVKNPDVQILASEGLSSTAMERNITDLLASIMQGLRAENLTVGTNIYIRYSRVPAMDVITEVLQPKVTIMLIGERPGLSTYASLSAYMTYEGFAGISESKRTVVSNIHENGTMAAEAGALIAEIVGKMLEQKASGSDLKLF